MRFELVNQLPETSHPVLLIECVAAVLLRWRLYLFKADQRGGPCVAPGHRGSGGVVRDAIHPGIQRAAPFVVFEAQPERDMNLLEEVLTLVGVRLVRPGQTVERRAARRR